MTDKIEFPYTTPIPAPTTNGANGFRWCHECQSVADVAGHECGLTAGKFGEALVVAMKRALVAEERAEFAESLLCALAFDHQVAIDAAPDHPCDWIPSPCIFCDAARGGGR